LKALKNLSSGCDNSPVFTFENGTYLTNQKLNAVIRFFLEKRIGKRAANYSCQSFRGGLPSALASKPNVGNDGSIKNGVAGCQTLSKDTPDLTILPKKRFLKNL
jgi:hypothetical protein